MEIQHHQETGKGEFYIKDTLQHKLAVITYVMTDEITLLIEHTVVSDQLKGQGAGKKLVEAVVQFARANGFTIIPQCPFAASVFQKTPEYADVLKQ